MGYYEQIVNDRNKNWDMFKLVQALVEDFLYDLDQDELGKFKDYPALVKAFLKFLDHPDTREFRVYRVGTRVELKNIGSVVLRTLDADIRASIDDMDGCAYVHIDDIRLVCEEVPFRVWPAIVMVQHGMVCDDNELNDEKAQVLIDSYSREVILRAAQLLKL